MAKNKQGEDRIMWAPGDVQITNPPPPPSPDHFKKHKPSPGPPDKSDIDNRRGTGL